MKITIKGTQSGYNHKKIRDFILALNVTISCKHVHRIELQFFFNFSRFLILDNLVQNKKYVNFVLISSLTGKCAAQKRTFAVLVYGHVYIIW